MYLLKKSKELQFLFLQKININVSTFMTSFHLYQFTFKNFKDMWDPCWYVNWCFGYMLICVCSSYTEHPAWWRLGWRPPRLYTWPCKLQHVSLSRSWSPGSCRLTSGSADSPLYKNIETHTRKDMQNNGKLSIHYTLIKRVSSGHWSLSDI